jgi:hypothetical protein
MNTVRTSGYKMRKYLKEKSNKLETNSSNKNTNHFYRGIHEFKVYQRRTSFVKDENSDLLTKSHSIFKRQKNYFCQLMNVHPSPRWLVLYLDVMRGLACLCDPESDVCGGLKLLAGLTKQIRSKERDQTKVGPTSLSEG